MAWTWPQLALYDRVRQRSGDNPVDLIAAIAGLAAARSGLPVGS
jgi:hypothetical protein